MGTYEVKLKTHSREDLTANYPQLNNCLIHKEKPRILDIVSGKRKEHIFVATCKHDDCGKISSTSADEVVEIWNKWNPLT